MDCKTFVPVYIFLDCWLRQNPVHKKAPVSYTPIQNWQEAFLLYLLYSYSSSDSSSSTIAAVAPDLNKSEKSIILSLSYSSPFLCVFYKDPACPFLSAPMYPNTSDPLFLLIIDNSIAHNRLIYQWHCQRFSSKIRVKKWDHPYGSLIFM